MHTNSKAQVFKCLEMEVPSFNVIWICVHEVDKTGNPFVHEMHSNSNLEIKMSLVKCAQLMC